MDSDGYYWFDSPTMEYGIDEDEPEESQEEGSQTESPSLPSLPLSLQEQLACPEITYSQRNQAMSMKEIDTKLNTLRRENFDLKLRLFYEKQNKGVRRSDVDQFIDKDFEKHEKILEEYKRTLAAKDHQISVLKNRLDESLRDKEFELNLLRNERDTFASELQVTTSVCKSFMAHLYDVREFWTRHLTEKGIERDENFIDTINYWLNSSEDLLNSASVLISDEFDGVRGQQRRLHPDLMIVDKNVNRGMSSLGLLSDFSEFIAEKQRGRHQLDKISSMTQTLICSDDLDRLISYYQRDKLKSFANCFTQTDADLKQHYLSSQACQTLTKVTIDSGIQTDNLGLKHEEKCIGTEPLCLSSISSQTIQISTEKGVQFAERTKSSLDQYYTHHFQNQPLQQQSPHLDLKSRLSPTDIKSQSNLINKDFNPSRKLTRSASSSQQSLYSYKTILTPMTKPMFKNVDYSECENLREVDQKMVTPLLTRLRKSKNGLDDTRSTVKSRYSSFDDINYDRTNNSSNTEFKNEKTSSGRQYHMTSSYSTSKIYDIINNQVKGHNKGKKFNMEKLCFKDYNDTSFKKGLSGGADDCNLSSPDLGIGDSDQDMNSTLRAHISLGHYQLLRGNLNQLSSYLDCLDNLFRDCFILQSIDLSEYSAGMQPNLANLHQIFNSSRNICKNFAIEDENSVSMQLERIKAKKESMEKAITRQLRKTDKLLRKAKLNLKES